MEKIYPMQNTARKIGKRIQNTGPKCFAPFLITAMITDEEFRMLKQLLVRWASGGIKQNVLR
jgi:hypothetical protein